VTRNSLEDSFLEPAEGTTSLDQLIRLVKPGLREVIAGDPPCEPKDVADVVALLLAYCMAIERVLSQAAGRSGTLPGHAVSVRSYVEQALSGEARQGSVLRLTNYFKDAIVFLMKTHAGHQKAIDQFAQDLAEALRPAQIESRVKPSGLLKVFGLHEGAYWREFCRQFRHLDAAAVKQIAESQHLKSMANK